jgi:hypothetical protein
MRRLMFATASVLLVSSPALAVPILSGSYATSVLLLCQIEARVDASTGQLTVANNGTGSVAVQSATLNFDSTGGTFTQTVVAFQMSAILERLTDGSHRGSTAKRSSFTNGGSYSNTDTTATFGSATYDVVYGHISGTGVADSFTGVRSEGRNCLVEVQAQRR